MKKQKAKDESALSILKRLAERIEDATVDIHDIKTDLKMVKFRLGSVERNTELMKVDMEKMKTVLKKIEREVSDLADSTGEILQKMVTHDEFHGLPQRVSALEN